VIRAYIHEPDSLMARINISVVDHRDDDAIAEEHRL
jgi:hypothetical protein